MFTRLLAACGVPTNLLADFERALIWVRDARERLEDFEDAHSVAIGAMDISCARRPTNAQRILDQFRG